MHVQTRNTTNLFLNKLIRVKTFESKKAKLSRILKDLDDFVILDHSGQGFDRISQWSNMDDEGSNMSEPSRLLIDENVSSAPASPGHLVPNSTTVKAGMDYSTAPKMATMVCFHKIFAQNSKSRLEIKTVAFKILCKIHSLGFVKNYIQIYEFR